LITFCGQKNNFFCPPLFQMIANNPLYQISAATLSDLNGLRELDRVCFEQDQWPLIELIAVLALPGVVRLKVEVDGKMAGFIGGDTHRTDGVGWITTIGVLPEFRRQGIARALMLACDEAMGQPIVRLSVRRSNYFAQQLYSSLGFRYTEVWHRYYVDGEDGLVMEKNNLKND
jgi:ribosomal-protein-alanine N-acetyltransferase